MQGIRTRWFALAQYRYLPHVLTLALILLQTAAVDAHGGEEDLFGWVCFICGCGWMGSHFAPPPWGCWWAPNPAGCWVHPSDSCIYIKNPLEV